LVVEPARRSLGDGGFVDRRRPQQPSSLCLSAAGRPEARCWFIPPRSCAMAEGSWCSTRPTFAGRLCARERRVPRRSRLPM